MADLNPKIIESINSLLRGYQSDLQPSRTWWLNWFFRIRLWFFPSSLKKALTQILEEQNGINIDNVQAVYHALITETWFFQRWFFYYLGDFFQDGLGYQLKYWKNPILTTPHYFNLISTHPNPPDMVWGLDMLSKANLLTPTHEATLLRIIRINDSMLVDPAHPLRLNDSRLLSVSRLLKADILTQENLDICLISRDYHSIVSGLVLLAEAGLYTSSNREAFLSCESPYDAAEAFFYMNYVHTSFWTVLSKGILTQENFNDVINHRNIKGASAAINRLWRIQQGWGSISQAHFDKALSLPNPQNFAYALHPIWNVDICQTIDYLFQHVDVLLTDAAGQLWSRIPQEPGIFDFDAVRQICDDTSIPLITRRRNFAQYVNHLLGQDNNRVQPLNDDQSTHTASVHAFVSQSASKLLERYGSKIMGHHLESLCNKIKEAVSNLSDDNPLHRAAKRGIARITAPDCIFIDLDSQVSIKQLVALSWLAIHDETLRRGSLKEAQAQFVNGLYEIQRGYNLSADNIDNQQEDKPICLAGTFNKLVEKLASIHPDCEIRVVTKALATLKLPQEVKAQATRFLQQHIRLSSEKEGYSTFNALSKQIKDSGTEVIWKDIKKAVFDRMFEEFGSLYHNNKEDKEFNTLMDYGEQCDIVSSVAEVKLSLLIREEAKRYLEQCAGIKTQEGSLAFNTLIEQIMKDGGVVIWPQIKEAVTARLFEEFKMYYGNDKMDKRFKSLIDNAKHGDVLKSEILAMAQQQQKLLQPNPSGFFSASNTIERERSPLNKAICNKDLPLSFKS